ncbi:MAG: hypothetical protein WBX81_03545 [Nitrososphaeraceae archaeon]
MRARIANGVRKERKCGSSYKESPYPCWPGKSYRIHRISSWVQTGTYRPVDNIYRQRDRGANDALSGRRCEPYSFVDKLFRKIEAIRIDKLADAIVNPPALSSQGIRKTNSTAVPVVSRFTFPSQDIFGISGYLCQTCLR